MNTHTRKLDLLKPTLMASALLSTTVAYATVKMWDGSSNGNWSVDANWSGGAAPVDDDDIVFPVEATNFVSTNDIVGLDIRSITFQEGGYVLRGNALSITTADGINGDQASGVDTIELDLTLTTAQTFSCTSAGAKLTVTGDIAKSGGLTVTGAGEVELSGAVSGTGPVSMNGVGVLTLSGSQANTYGDTTHVNAGTIVLAKTGGMLAVPNNVVIGNGGGPDILRLDLDNQISTNANVTMRGVGRLDLNGHSQTINNLTFLSGGIVQSGAGTLTLRGEIAANASTIQAQFQSRLNLPAGDHSFALSDGGAAPDVVISGELTGGGGILKQGSGNLELAASNSFFGGVTISEGEVLAGDVHSFGQDEQEVTVTVETNGLLTINAPATVVALAGSGSVVLNADLIVGNYLDYSDNEFSGSISGSGGLLYLGQGTWTLSGTNTYVGNTDVSNGKLVVNGFQPQTTIDVYVGAELGGTGVIGHLSGYTCRIDPGESPGVLTCSNLYLGDSGLGSADFQVELSSTNAGGYDQLKIYGTVELADVTLTVAPGFVSGLSNQFTLIANDGADAVMGTFDGLPEGIGMLLGGEFFTITYVGGDGNDVVLTQITDSSPPVLTITPTGPGEATISWFPPNLGQVLQETLSLATPVWTNSPTWNTNPATIILEGPVKFYRVFMAPN